LKVTAHESGTDTVLQYSADVEPIMDAAAAARREDRERGAFQKRSEFRRTMTVPVAVLMKIREERGLDFMNPEHSKALSKILKAEYPLFRTTDKARR
jgi:hypothetical protein